MKNKLLEVTHNLISKNARLTQIIKHLTVILLLYLISHLAIFPSRGMDFSDEGYYLLSADPSLPSDANGWPFGWNLQSLFSVVNYSISNFRILGFVILGYSAFLFANSFLALILHLIPLKYKIDHFLVVLTIIASAHLYYAGFLRTPSYNWLNLVGILVTLSGFFSLLQKKIAEKSIKRGNWLQFFGISLGEFIALPAKPSTPFIMIMIIAIFFALIFSLGSGVVMLLQQIFSLSILYFAALMFHYWPNSQVFQLKKALGMPPPAENQTLSGAILDTLSTPLRMYNSVRNHSQLLLFAIVAILIFVILARRMNTNSFLVLSFLSCTSISAFTYIYAISIEDAEKNIPVSQNKSLFFISLPLLYLVLVLFVLDLAIRELKNRTLNLTHEERKILFLIQLVLLCGIALFGFGSSAGIIGKLSAASVLLVAASIMLAIILSEYHALGNTLIRVFSGFLLLVLIVIGTSSLRFPYGSPAINKLKYEVAIGNHDKTIKLNKESANQIFSLRKNAWENGFNRNTNVVNIVYPSGVGYGYALGGRQSPNIIFIWFGYPNSLRQFNYLVESSTNGFDFQNSWLLKSPDGLYLPEESTYSSVMNTLKEKSNNHFPEDYELIFSDDQLELWKPLKK